MVYMHGRKNFLLSEEERDQLLMYLSNGGFLFADACCGSSQFDTSFRKLVEQLFGQQLERITTTTRRLCSRPFRWLMAAS